jgi:hypothetical protein
MPSYAYQWEVNGVDVSGATGTTFDTTGLVVDDEVACTVTATNDFGSTEATSNIVTITDSPPTDMILSASTVVENSPEDTVVGELSTIAGTFPYSYAITAQEHANWFKIVGEELRVGSDSPDFETDASATVTIEVTDDDSRTYEETFTITITNVTTGHPTITSSATASVAENATLSHALTSTPAGTWTIVGGADQARFEISGTTLRWLGNGTKDFEDPDDANTDNAYIVTVRAAAEGETNDQTITVTVTDVVETVATTLNPADKHADIGLSNGDLTGDNDSGGGNWRSVRATRSFTTEKVYFEATLTSLGTFNWTFVGIMAASQSLASFVGAGEDGVGYQVNNGLWSNGGFVLDTDDTAMGGPFGVGDTLAFAIDGANRKFWVKDATSGDWNGVGSDDPETNTGGYSWPAGCLASSEAWFIAMSAFNAGQDTTFNFGGTAFAGTEPAGFSAPDDL